MIEKQPISSTPKTESSSENIARKKPKKRLVLRIKRKSKDDFRENFSENRMYYEKLADKYHVFRNVVSVLLTLWMILRTVLTYGAFQDDSVNYLNKVLKINPANIDSQYHTISYAAGNGASFAFYKNDLAVIGEGKISVYDLTGDRRFHSQTKHSAKAFSVSDKYIALYSPGEKGFSLYNSFSCVYEYHFPGAVWNSAVSDSGKFAVCFKENEQNVIEVYHENFKKAFSLTLAAEQIIYSMALSPNGDKLAVTTISMKGSVYGSEFTVYDVSSKKILTQEKIEGKKPIVAEFFANGRIFFAAEGSIFFYQANGKKTETVTIPNASYKVYRDGNELSVICGGTQICGYSSKGALLAKFSPQNRILDCKIKNGVYYVLSDQTVEVYEENGVVSASCGIRSGVKDYFILPDQSVLICYITETDRIVP